MRESMRAHLAVGLYGRPEVDQVGSRMSERHVGLGAADQRVQHSALVDALQVAQVFAQVLLRRVALRKGGKRTRQPTGLLQTNSCSNGRGLGHLLDLVLGDIVQRAVCVQADPHSACGEFRCPLVWLQLCG